MSGHYNQQIVTNSTVHGHVALVFDDLPRCLRWWSLSQFLTTKYFFILHFLQLLRYYVQTKLHEQN